MVDSTDLRTTPDKPRRRSYRTGEALPELTDSFRPVQLGRDSVGNPDSQIRAFATAILNRSDRPIYVKEGEESDEIKIDRFESYDIWETNGISRVYLRGETGGEEAVVRTLEAHNDFSITDKIDAFIRGISHFLQSAKSETVITGAETEIDIGSVSGGLTVDSITTDITVDSITQGITVDTGTISVDSLPNVTVDTITDGIDVDAINTDITVGTINDGISIDDGTISVDSLPSVTVGTINDGITVDGGNVSADVAGNVTVDDITAASASFDGDITGQTNFDLTAAVREGQTQITTLSEYDLSEAVDPGIGEDVIEYHSKEIYSPAAFDGSIQRVDFRVFDYDEIPGIGFKMKVDYGSTGDWDTVSPRSAATFRLANRYGGGTVQTPRYYPNGEGVIIWEPNNPVRFSEGDSVGIEVAAYNQNNLSDTRTYSVEAEIITREIRKV